MGRDRANACRQVRVVDETVISGHSDILQNIRIILAVVFAVIFFIFMIADEIEKALEIVRPMLALHRGGVEFVSYDAETKTANLRLSGVCVGCPLADLTLKGGIEEVLRAKVPGVEKVEAVN